MMTDNANYQREGHEVIFLFWGNDPDIYNPLFTSHEHTELLCKKNASES